MQTRKTQRKIVSLPGRYFTGSGAPVDVMLTDVSVGGCRFKSDSAKLAQGSALQMMIAGTGPHHATIKWVRKGEVGLTFARELNANEFEQFQSCHVEDANSFAAADRFEAMRGSLPRRYC